MKYKSVKTFIDYNDGMTYLGFPILMIEPKYALYYQDSYIFGLINFWRYRMTCSYDPKKYLDVIESNY